MAPRYDFSGWATKYDILCSDGRTIKKNAFPENDGQIVPLVWNHQHASAENVLGHALLQSRDEGMYTYCKFNETPQGQNAKQLVQHGDVTSLSIYANQLKQIGGDVVHGMIREVSLVLAGANIGATIDDVIMHGEFVEGSAIIYSDDLIELAHSDEESNTEKKEETKMAASEDKTVQDVLDTMNEEQLNVTYALIGQAIADAKGGSDNDEEDDEDMKHNVFDNDTNETALYHAAEDAIISGAKREGSMKESFLSHAADYGIDQIDWLMPEYTSVTGDAPQFINTKPDGWVQKIMNGVHHTPFSRIKMMFADITADAARAKGYIKGKYKKEEVFGLLKRTVDPTTVYKKQKMDRDDIIDITDFNVVAWLKGEMRLKLDEELARAFIFGDGRSAMDEDKVDDRHIIPVVSDEDLYCMKFTLEVEPGESEEHALINAVLTGQDDYDGSGNITAFMPNKKVTKMLLMEDANGHRLYKNIGDLALAMGVDSIVKVPVNIVPEGVLAVCLDLSDYNVGADKGGSVNMFEDFDIDYNQQKYLIETRCSGALIKPYSAFVIKTQA